jgi:hypothetical protein
MPANCRKRRYKKMAQQKELNKGAAENTVAPYIGPAAEAENYMKDGSFLESGFRIKYYS